LFSRQEGWMTKLAALAVLVCACSNNGLSVTGDMGTDDGGCAAFRACYTQPNASMVNCEPGFSSLAIARAVELEECKQVACLSDSGDASPRICDNAEDTSPTCKQCLANAEHGGPLGACTPPSDPHCGAC